MDMMVLLQVINFLKLKHGQALPRGHEREIFNLYNVSGRLAGTYRGEKIGEGLRAGVYYLKQVSGNLRPVRFVLGR
jgi:hypothetical protein